MFVFKRCWSNAKPNKYSTLHFLIVHPSSRLLSPQHNKIQCPYNNIFLFYFLLIFFKEILICAFFIYIDQIDIWKLKRHDFILYRLNIRKRLEHLTNYKLFYLLFGYSQETILRAITYSRKYHIEKVKFYLLLKELE